MRHLEGLAAVYNLGPQAAPADQSRAWNALSCAEKDLELVYAGYSSNQRSATATSILSTPLGLVEPRKGGLPMRIRYFLPPYHLIDPATNRLMEPS